MTTATFSERMDELRHLIGTHDGHLRGEIIVDQVYAHYQHERLDLRHPRGGGPHYLTRPLFKNYRRYLEWYAKDVLTDGGHRALIHAMEHMSDEVEVYAPVEFADLRRSGHPRVYAGQRLIYDRAPRQHRLTKTELRIKSRLRKLPPELIGWIWWHVMHKQEPPPHLGGRRSR